MKNISENLFVKMIFAGSLLLLFLIAGCSDGSGGGGDQKTASSDAFTFTTIEDETISLDDFKGKKAVIVDIWATWCGPCKKEMPELQEIYEKYSDQLEIIAASQDDPKDTAKVREFVESNGLTFKIVHDATRQFPRKYPLSTKGIPYTALIDKDGKKVKEFLGYQENLEKKVVDALGLESS